MQLLQEKGQMLSCHVVSWTHLLCALYSLSVIVTVLKHTYFEVPSTKLASLFAKMHFPHFAIYTSSLLNYLSLFEESPVEQDVIHLFIFFLTQDFSCFCLATARILTPCVVVLYHTL